MNLFLFVTSCIYNSLIAFLLFSPFLRLFPNVDQYKFNEKADGARKKELRGGKTLPQFCYYFVIRYENVLGLWVQKKIRFVV